MLLELTEEGQRRLGDLAAIQAQVNDVHFGSLTKRSFDHARAIMPQLVHSTDPGLSLLRGTIQPQRARSIVRATRFSRSSWRPEDRTGSSASKARWWSEARLSDPS